MVSASKLDAGDEAYLVAGENLALLSAEDYDYSLYQKKKKGSFGRKSFKRNESTQVTNVGSDITTGGDLTLLSEGDQLYQRAHLESGNDLTLASGGDITFEGVKDLKQESREKSKSSFAWQSAKGKGKTDETLKQSELIAQGDLVIKAVDGLKIDIKQVNQQTVSQIIDAMVKADPNLAWLKEAEARGDVDWRRVKEVHDSFKYSSSGLGAGASMVIAIAVAYFTAGAMSGLVANGATAAGASTAATSAGGAWAAGTGASLSGIGWANAAVTAGLTGMTSNAAISTINNRGNLGAVFKDITSEDALRGYAVAGVTAGLTNGLYDGWVGTETGTAGAIQNGGKVIAGGGGLSTLEGIGRFAGNQLLQNGTSTVLDRALGGDSSFSDALRNSLANTFAAAGFNLIGDVTAKGQLNLADGSPAKIAMHAVMGGLAAEAAGGDFKTGALAAGVNEALVGQLSDWYGQMDPEQKKSLLVMNSQVIGVLAAAAQGGDEKALQTGGWVAKNATAYNYILHQENAEKAIDDATERCKSDPLCPAGGASIDRSKVLEALGALAAKDEGAVRGFDEETLFFTSYMLHRDPDLRDEIFIPETLGEKVLDWGKLVYDLLSPTPGGKPQVVKNVATKVSAEAAEALEKKFADALAQEAKEKASGLLPKPGATSVPANGVGAGATFKAESTKQLGKKFGRHVKDFGGDPSNPADRKMVFDRIQDIGNNPEKVISGKFSGQGVGGVIGDVFFRIKGNDVVVTKPDGSFVTILKDGVLENTFVKNALKGK